MAYRPLFVAVSIVLIASCTGQNGSFTAKQLSYKCELTFDYQSKEKLMDGDLFQIGLTIFTSLVSVSPENAATFYPGFSGLKDAVVKSDGAPFPISKEAIEHGIGLVRLAGGPSGGIVITKASAVCPVSEAQYIQ